MPRYDDAMRKLLVMLAACGGVEAAPSKQVDAWQAFAVGPFKTMRSGGVRAFFAADVPEPTWVKDTFAGLSLAGYDGSTLTGEVELWSGAGLDPMKCAVEVIWDDHAKRGVRVDHPPQLAQGTAGGWHARWRFEASVSHPPAILSAAAFVFCPIDDAHERPPWGASFSSLEAVAAGPKAHDAYCAQKPKDPDNNMQFGTLAGKRTMDVAFACGVLVRMKGRDLVDDCKGDVLFSLDMLGPATTTTAAATGGAISDEELGHFMAGSSECARLTLTGFDAKNQRAWDAAIKRLGQRVIYVGSRDGIRQP
jgi:hypothetical protein